MASLDQKPEVAGRHGILALLSSTVRQVNVLLVVAIVVDIGIPVVVSAATGNLSIPHADAWSYSRIAQVFGQTGEIVLLGWNRSALIGQYVVLGPLASSVVLQQLFVAVLGVVCLLCVFDLLRPKIGSKRAAFASLLLGLWPGFSLLSTSFMADIPALTGALGALALGRRALNGDSRMLFVLSMVVGFWGTTIRAQALAAPVALLLYAFFSRRSRNRIGVIFVVVNAAAFAAIFLAFSLWYSTLPNGDPPSLQLASSSLGTTADLLTRSYFTLALPLAPAVLLVARPWNWGRPALTAGVAVAVVGVLALHDFGSQGFFLGNYLEPNGAYAAVLPGNRTVIPHSIWLLVVALALVSGVLLSGLLIERWRNVDPLVGLFTTITALGTIATGLAGQGIFDRYLLALAPAALAAVLGPRSVRTTGVAQKTLINRLLPNQINRIVAAVAVACFAILSGALTANAFSFDAARWEIATTASATGVPANRIDAGLEWLGFHSAQGMSNHHPTSGYGWEPYFSAVPSCEVLTTQPNVPTWTLEKSINYHTFLVTGISSLYLYKTLDCRLGN